MLTMIAEMDKPVEPSFPAQHRLTVKGQEVDYSISLDISSPPPLSVPSGKVEIVNKGQVWLGAFDFDAWYPVGLDRAPDIGSLCPET